MKSQYSHAVLPKSNHDEQSRQDYYMDIRHFLASRVAPGNKLVFNKKVKPKYLNEHGREPKDRHEVKKLMVKNEYYQLIENYYFYKHRNLY